MKTQEFAKKSGVSKRNIHFYIAEKLITPKLDTVNGYFDFGEEDVERLKAVKALRAAGFSIAAIRALFQTPASAEYYFRIRAGRLKQELEELQEIQGKLGNALEALSVEPDLQEIYQVAVNCLEGEPEKRLSYDGLLVNHFLWRVYLPETMTEYQQFLWDKINRRTDEREKNQDYAGVYDFLCSQEEKKIEELYAKRNRHYTRIAEMNEEEVRGYSEEMRQNIVRFLQQEERLRQWKMDMETLNQYLMRIYTSELGTIAEEMCPLFGAYKTKSQAACKMVYDWLHTEEGRPLLEQMEKKLGASTNLERCSHAELESMSMAMLLNP